MFPYEKIDVRLFYINSALSILLKIAVLSSNCSYKYIDLFLFVCQKIGFGNKCFICEILVEMINHFGGILK